MTMGDLDVIRLRAWAHRHRRTLGSGSAFFACGPAQWPVVGVCVAIDQTGSFTDGARLENVVLDGVLEEGGQR